MIKSITQDIPFAQCSSSQKNQEYSNSTVEKGIVDETASFKFRHIALPDAKTYIHLLEVEGTLAKDDTRTKLACTLTVWPANEAPSYHAISYTWCPKYLTTDILIHGKELEVTRNCDYALRQSQWHGGVGYVWIDSICIDQANNNEKCHQVEMMGNIYRNASQVLACVGSHADDSELVMSTRCQVQFYRSKLVPPGSLIDHKFTNLFFRCCILQALSC